MKNKVKLMDYMRNWKRNSLFVRMMGQLFLLVIIPLCGIMAVSYYSYTSMWNQEMKRQCSNMAESLVIKWNGIEAEMEQEFSFVSYDNEVELFIYDEQLSQIHYNVQNIRKLFLLPALTRDYVENVYVYNIGNGAVIDKAGIHDIAEYKEKLNQSDWYVMLMNEIDSVLTKNHSKQKIVFLVYFELLYPPKQERIINEDRFVMLFCPYGRDFRKSYDEYTPREYTPALNKFTWDDMNGDLYLSQLSDWKKVFNGESIVFDYNCS